MKQCKCWKNSPNLTSFHLHHSPFSNPSAALPTPQLILQTFRCFTYVTAHSPTLPSLHLRHSLFYNTSAASPTSQIILQTFRCFIYVICTSPTSPGEPPMFLWWCIIYPWWFYNLQLLRPAGLYERCKFGPRTQKVEDPWCKWYTVESKSVKSRSRIFWLQYFLHSKLRLKVNVLLILANRRTAWTQLPKLLSTFCTYLHSHNGLFSIECMFQNTAEPW